MYVFCLNGKIIRGKQPALTGHQVASVLLTKEDFNEHLVPYLENCVITRMVDIAPDINNHAPGL